jgi:hypothetical protein
MSADTVKQTNDESIYYDCALIKQARRAQPTSSLVSLQQVCLYFLLMISHQWMADS